MGYKELTDKDLDFTQEIIRACALPLQVQVQYQPTKLVSLTLERT